MLFVIAGLGNPGQKYDRTRHNAGFHVVDHLAEQHVISLDRDRFFARTGSGSITDCRVLLLEPVTFMNLSGKSVAAAVRFFKVPIQRLIVVHDDVDLPLGRIQVRRGGGHGGHKGLVSIIESLGEAGFVRMRLGIGRPRFDEEVADFVLRPFEQDELQKVGDSISRAAQAIACWLSEGLTTTMNRFNAFGQGEEEK